MKQPRMKRRTTSLLVLAYKAEHASFINIQSRACFRNFLSWEQAACFHLKLLMVPTVRKRSVGPGYTVVVPWSPSQTAQRAQEAGGIFSLSFFTSISSWRPGVKLWVSLHGSSWKDPCINGRNHAGTVGCNGEVPSRPVEEVFLVLGTRVLLDECTEIQQAFAACSSQYSLHRSTGGTRIRPENIR